MELSLSRLCVTSLVLRMSAIVALGPVVQVASAQGGGNTAGPSAQGVAAAGVTAFVGVAVVPMDRDTVLTDQTVLVTDGRITALGPTNQVQVPQSAVRIDGRGKFLLPGLADMHAHLQQGPHIGIQFAGSNPIPIEATPADSAQEEQRLFLWLANGATTIRDVDYGEQPGTNTVGQRAMQFRARAAAGHEWIPHIYTAGEWAPLQYIGYAYTPAPEIDSVPTYVAAYKAAGYDFIKIHNEPPDVVEAVLKAAKKIGIPVIGHVPPPTQVEWVLNGLTCIEHPVNDYFRHGMTEWNALDTTDIGKLAGAMKRAGVWNDPTQSHYDRLHYVPQVYGPRFNDPPKILKILQDSGVKLLIGTDETPWTGVITTELQSFVNAGLTPYQALLAATRNVAEYFGTLNESGTITVGKRADLVLLTGNPLRDIRYTAQPAGVMLGGRWLSRAEIDRRLATMKLPTFTDDRVVPAAPLKSYWNNVADMMREAARPLLLGITLSDTSGHIAHKAQWQALIDSLGQSDQYAVGTQRLLTMLARHFTDDRALLTADQRATFDTKASVWLKQRRQEGYKVDIAGVAP